MTDTHHSSDLLSAADEIRADPGWGAIVAAVLALLLVVTATHLIEQDTNDRSQVLDAEKTNIQLDGRGKWIGYM